eukprot:GSChrysophyteH1.ASY1.ANO1.1441.1 assembled CDS
MSTFANLTRGVSFAKRKSKGSTLSLSSFKGGDRVNNSSTPIDFRKLAGLNRAEKTDSMNGNEDKNDVETEESEDDDDSSDDASEPTKKTGGRNDRHDETETANALRNSLSIRVRDMSSKESIPHPAVNFDDMDLHHSIKKVVLSNIEKSAWKEPTAIQMQAIPCLLSGRDVLGAAPTGSGKTASFVLPALSLVKQGVKVLILAPTKELSEQIYRETLRLSSGRRLKICLLKRSSNKITLDALKMIILDEADKLFELKTHGQIDEILASCPQDTHVHKALFSATIGPMVTELASQFLHNPIRISIGTDNTEGLKPPVLIFMQSIERAKELYKELAYDGINVDVIHAEKSPTVREDIIRRFRVGDIWVLICTELMARGVDFKGIRMVINYDLPQSTVDYIHRIGRTGRAGKEGTAITLFTEADIPRLRSIANIVKQSGCDVPDWMLTIPKMTTKEKRALRRSAPLRRRIDTGVHPVRQQDPSGTPKTSNKKKGNKNRAKKIAT